MKVKSLWILLLIVMLALAACGGGPAGGPEAESAAEEASEAPSEEAAAEEPAVEESAPEESEPEGPQLAEELSVYNWDDYIDEELLVTYEEAYGVNIIYDTFASNEDLLAKLQAGATGYDVIFPSDYMVSQMMELGLLAEIDTNEMPNFRQYR